MKEALQSGQPSKYHTYKMIDGKAKWVLNRQHPRLRSTTTCKIGHRVYCAYCGAVAGAIQARLWAKPSYYYERYDKEYERWLYEVTGYTCDCNQARLERRFQDESEEFEKKQADRRRKFRQKYLKRLTVDKPKLLSIKHKMESNLAKSGSSLTDILTIDNAIDSASIS